MYKKIFFLLCHLLATFNVGLLSALENIDPNVYLNDDKASELITVVTATSPIFSHPDTKFIYQAQESLMQIPGLAKCKKIIVFDAIRPGYEFLTELYEKYKQNVIELTKNDPVFSNTELVFCSCWSHLSGAVKEAINYVKTPFVFIHQHDLKLIKKFDLNSLLQTMLVNPNVKYVHFWGNWNHDQWYNGPVDDYIEGVHYVPLTRSFGWSDQCHVATTDYYRYFVLPQCYHHGFMESVMHPALWQSISAFGMNDGHRPFGTYLYGNLTDGHYISHLDARNN